MVSASLVLGVACAFAATFSVSVSAAPAVVDSPYVPDGGREKAYFSGLNREPCYYVSNEDHIGYEGRPTGQERCATWSWSDYNGGTCWLKSYHGGSVAKNGTISLSCSLEKYNLPPWTSTCTLYENIDFVGNDIGSKPGKTFHACCATCKETQGCSAYAWTQDNGGTCYLKSSVGHVVYKAGVISSSTVPLYGPVCPFEYDTDFVGMDIGSKPAKDAGVCCSQCKENKDCKAYSWSNYNGGTCWMKSGKGKTNKAAGVISAALFPTSS